MNWKTIEEFPTYQVSSTGLIKNKFGKLLKILYVNKGYAEVRFVVNKKTHRRTVHRIVSKAFIPNLENKKTVNHRDGNRANNNVSNLEWATHSENLKHSFSVLGRIPTWKGKLGKDHINAKPIKMLDKQGNFIKSFGSIIDAAKEMNISACNISLCINNYRKTAGNYKWSKM